MDITIPVWIITLISVGSSATITTIIGILLKYLFSKYIKNKENEDKLQREESLELLKLRAQKTETEQTDKMVKAINACIKPLEIKFDNLAAQLDKDSQGTLCTLRNDILTCYYKCVKKGYRNDYDYTNIHDLFKAYVALDGNSFVEDIIDRFDNLPTKEVFKASHPDLWAKKVLARDSADAILDAED